MKNNLPYPSRDRWYVYHLAGDTCPERMPAGNSDCFPSAPYRYSRQSILRAIEPSLLATQQFFTLAIDHHGQYRQGDKPEQQVDDGVGLRLLLFHPGTGFYATIEQDQFG